MNLVNRIGKIYGRLTVIELKTTSNGNSYWLCQCACGVKKVATGSCLQSGMTKSCGCLQIENGKKQGLASKVHGEAAHYKRTKTYRVWQGLIRRCCTSSATGYKNYGGRGIKVCSRWKVSYLNFKKDMGACPDGYSLDRKDNSGNYNKSNCRWASRSTQAKNSRRSIWIQFKGRRKILTEWSRLLSIPASTICQRLKRGLPIEKVLFQGKLSA